MGAGDVHGRNFERKFRLLNLSKWSSKFMVFLSSLAGITFPDILFHGSAHTRQPVAQGSQIIDSFNAWVCYILLIVVLIEDPLNQRSRYNNLMFSLGAAPIHDTVIIPKKFTIHRKGSWVLFHAVFVPFLLCLIFSLFKLSSCITAPACPLRASAWTIFLPSRS